MAVVERNEGREAEFQLRGDLGLKPLAPKYKHVISKEAEHKKEESSKRSTLEYKKDETVYRNQKKESNKSQTEEGYHSHCYKDSDVE